MNHNVCHGSFSPILSHLPLTPFKPTQHPTRPRTPPLFVRDVALYSCSMGGFTGGCRKWGPELVSNEMSHIICRGLFSSLPSPTLPPTDTLILNKHRFHPLRICTASQLPANIHYNTPAHITTAMMTMSWPTMTAM